MLAAVFDSQYLKKARIPSVIVAATICAATVFVKQHSILDVFAALALSLVLYLVIYVAREAPRHGRTEHAPAVGAGRDHVRNRTEKWISADKCERPEDRGWNKAEQEDREVQAEARRWWPSTGSCV
ncbi:MAG: hypothetical protein ACLUNO_01035 [Oscillospiraceae bacterium]